VRLVRWARVGALALALFLAWSAGSIFKLGPPKFWGFTIGSVDVIVHWRSE
jgi:hypothetical protein